MEGVRAWEIQQHHKTQLSEDRLLTFLKEHDYC